MGTLAMVAENTGGELMGLDQTFESVSTDTRTLRRGELFFALRGENFNAADFVVEAAARGAAGAVVEKPCDCDLPQVRVDDPRLALGMLARAWRRRFELKVIAVTGSNGKTTVKEMLAAILGAERSGAPETVLATRGNLNNDIGLPLTVLDLREHHLAAVLEIGANHPGEVGTLANIAAPQVGVITNAARAHLEGFGSIEQVAVSKGELLDHLSDDSVAVLNRDDPFFSCWEQRCKSSKLSSFGLTADADFRADDVRENTSADSPALQFTMLYPDGKRQLQIPMAGRHNVTNALAAAAAARAVGVSMDTIAAGLAAVPNVSGRLRPIGTAGGAVVYDDSYNANPASVRAAISFLAGLNRPRWLVLGDMGELGDSGETLHREIGAAAGQAGIEQLFCVGPLSRFTAEAFGTGAEWCDSVDKLADSLCQQLQPGLNILVKGSRFMGLDRLVKRIVAAGSKPALEG